MVDRTWTWTWGKSQTEPYDDDLMYIVHAVLRNSEMP